MENNKIKQGDTGNYIEVNGLKMYFEVYGEGKPLVLIHGGGSTIQTSFSRLIPLLAKSRQLIAVELQAHGRTDDRSTPLSFQQDADDVAMLLQNIRITNADFLGFSNGGQTVFEIALRHPHLVNKLILCSTFYKRSAATPQFWESFKGNIQFSHMPQLLKDGFLNVNNQPAALLNMFNKDVARMKAFKGWSDEQLKSIKAAVLVVNGNEDVGSPEHAIEMFRILPHAKLAILPGGHGEYLGEITSGITHSNLQVISAMLFEEFLNEVTNK